MKFIKLAHVNTLLEMPIVGLGTWRAQPAEVEKALWAALDAGYRHIGKCKHLLFVNQHQNFPDTAFNYNSEETIGNVIKEWISQGKGKREDLFITTKVGENLRKKICFD